MSSNFSKSAWNELCGLRYELEQERKNYADLKATSRRDADRLMSAIEAKNLVIVDLQRTVTDKVNALHSLRRRRDELEARVRTLEREKSDLETRVANARLQLDPTVKLPPLTEPTYGWDPLRFPGGPSVPVTTHSVTISPGQITFNGVQVAQAGGGL